MKGRSFFMISSSFFCSAVVAGPILQLHSLQKQQPPTSLLGCLLWLWPTHVRCKNFMLNATSPHPTSLFFYNKKWPSGSHYIHLVHIYMSKPESLFSDKFFFFLKQKSRNFIFINKCCFSNVNFN